MAKGLPFITAGLPAAEALKQPGSSQLHAECLLCLERTKTCESEVIASEDIVEASPSSTGSSHAYDEQIRCNEEVLEDGWPSQDACCSSDYAFDSNQCYGSSKLQRQVLCCEANSSQHNKQECLPQEAVQSPCTSTSNAACSSSLPIPTGVPPRLRAFVVDLVIRAADTLCLANDSMFLAVAILDRYIAAEPCIPEELLCPVGIACLFIAAKFQEVSVRPSSHFAALMSASAGAVPHGVSNPNVQLLLQLEAEILQALDYRIANITTAHTAKYYMLERFSASSAAVQLSPQQRILLFNMTSYLTEAALLELNLMPLAPEALAATAFAFAHLLTGLYIDEQLLQQVCGYSLQDLSAPASWLGAVHGALYGALEINKPYYVTIKYCARAGGVSRAAPILSPSDERLWRSQQVKLQQQQQLQASRELVGMMCAGEC